MRFARYFLPFLCTGFLMLAFVSSPGETAAQSPVEVFHSTHSANLPTATTIRRGLWIFEISHRFRPAIEEGGDALWGLDGPVYNRLGLAYAPSDRVMVGLVRSNLQDNLELNAKVGLLDGEAGDVRYAVGAMAGAAFNTGVSAFGGIEDDEAQFYAHAMLNAAAGERFAIGVVPTVFHNPRIEDVDPVTTFVLGLHGQYHATSSISLLAEWNLSVESVDYPYDAVSFGAEIETRGHFFKLLVTNQVRMNPTQFLVGTPYGYGGDDWRLGFNVMRLLSF